MIKGFVGLKSQLKGHIHSQFSLSKDRPDGILLVTTKKMAAETL